MVKIGQMVSPIYNGEPIKCSCGCMQFKVIDIRQVGLQKYYYYECRICELVYEGTEFIITGEMP